MVSRSELEEIHVLTGAHLHVYLLTRSCHVWTGTFKGNRASTCTCRGWPAWGRIRNFVHLTSCNFETLSFYKTIHFGSREVQSGRRSGQSVTASDFGSNGPRFESGRGRCVESLDKALYSHCPKEKPHLASISYLAILVKYILLLYWQKKSLDAETLGLIS